MNPSRNPNQTLPPPPPTTFTPNSTTPRIKFNELERVNRIGSGSSGTVYKALHRPSGRHFALKVIYGHHDESIVNQILREFEIFRGIDNPNIIKCHDVNDHGGEIQVLLEYMDGGSLEGIHVSNEKHLSYLAYQILSGLAYLHQSKIVHRNIKPSNLLVNSKKQVKIADSGISRVVALSMDPCNSSAGTLAYLSPERINTDLNDGHYDAYAGDIWSFGVSILEIYLGRFPFAVDRDGHWASLLYAICMSDPPEAPATASREFRDFISCCLQKDPAKRCTAAKLLGHPFIVNDNPQSQQQREIDVANSSRMDNKGKEVILTSAAMESKYHVFLNGYNSLYNELLYELQSAGLNTAVGKNTSYDASDIEQSKLCIPIFSPDYASQESYLDEVAKMNECRRTSGQIVLPIFYNIKPSDVQNQTGPLEKYFLQFQEKGINPQVINKWTEALREVGSLEGFTVTKYVHHGKDVKEIFEQVIELLLYKVPLDNNLVGIEQSYQSVTKMLRMTSKGDIKMVGICGITGIGKTTLAQAVYNNLRGFFEYCSFVSNIQERSAGNGLHSLQNQLIKELLNTKEIDLGSFEDNLEFIKYSICHRRVLIVLDDVECLDHIKAFGVGLQCFGSGSRIILTTRKPELLVEARVPHRYFVEELDELHALNLFYDHAFTNVSPEREYGLLSTQIASSTRGIPLVIESVASYLSNYRNKEKERWEEVLQQLKGCQYKLLQELLMLSHDYLSKGRWRFYHDKECFRVEESDDIAHYDVVLSFDARDKVKNLVESLHKRMESFGIGIFALNGDSTQVHVTGKILIPVFSKSYASNSSCLEMLTHMVECRRSCATNHILPIFCAIEPSDVKLQTSSYGTFSGWSLPETCTTEEFYSLINSVCQMALDKLKLNWCFENHLVGIDEHVESIWNLLNPEVNDVRSIVIRGEDGSGKTTLAKIVYHQLSSSFEGCSFLTEIDESSQHPGGIRYLQAKLISHLLNKECEVFASVTEGINLIKERFQHMKVLIVLDDVAKSFHVEDLVGQLSWFGMGSRIIITAGVTTEIPLPHSNYMLMHENYWRRNLDTSRALLSMHTFGKGDPLPNFESLFERFADLLLRSPHPYLALEIVGSLLYGKDKEEWESTLQNLGNMDLKKILRMSYGRLNEMQKRILLDISCFPLAMGRQIASYLWYDSLHSPSSTDTDLEALILSLMVKIDANRELRMHRLVRDFARNIVHQERSQVKKRGETKRARLEASAPPGFERIPNIRFLKLDHANIIGSTNSFLMTQRGIIWEWRLLDSLASLHLEFLKVLDLSWSKVTEDWEGWHQIKVPQLRILNLTGCSDLLLTPVFSFCPNLEMLMLEHCSRLVNIDPSIGKLQCLTVLNLRYCLELCMLPNEVGYLTALRELLLDGTSLREIPVSIGHLKNLRCLTASNCLSLRHLPSSTCDLWFLTVIKLDCANIAELPHLFGKMKLQQLSLRGCRGIKRLESLVGEVESSLVELDVSKTSISELPKSIIKLKALRVLILDFCFIIEFPSHFGELQKLEEIHASWCRNLENLPNDIGGLASLRILRVGHSHISNVPHSIKMLTCLETLDCTSCSNLQSLPELPTSLTYLHVESKVLKELPDFAKLRRLKEFTLVNGDVPDISMVVTAGKDDPFPWLEESTFLRTLELCLPNITTLPGIPGSLRKLSLRCASLEHILSLPSRLVSLSIHDCASLKKMTCVKYTEILEELEIAQCPGIKKIEDLENLKTLKVLTISSSGIVSLDGLDKLSSLTRLTLSYCPAIEKIEGLENLQSLLVLTISSSGVVSLSGLDKLASLKNLTLSDCPELKQIEGFTKLQALEVLSISSSLIESLTGLDKLASLKKLTVLDCGSPSKFVDLFALKGVDVFIAENSY